MEECMIILHILDLSIIIVKLKRFLFTFTSLYLETIGTHLSSERCDGVLQFLSEFSWHQTFNLLLILLMHQGHLRTFSW